MMISTGILSRPFSFRLIPFAIAGILLSISGCKEITEADTGYRGEITTFNSELEEIGSFSIEESPGCLMTFPGHLIVATKDGNLYLYASETFELLGVNKIGPAAPEGYTEMIHIPGRNSAYLIGAYGNILDIDLPECTVKEMFSVCQLPLHLVYGGSGSSYFYVSDGINHTLNRVNISTNSEAGFCQFDETIRAVALYAPDSILVSFGGETDDILSAQSAGLLISQPAFMEEAKCLGTIPNRDYAAAVFSGEVGIVNLHLNEDSTQYVWEFDRQTAVEGNPLLMTCNEMLSAYLLSYTGNETSVLYRYDYTNGIILNQVELQGFPLDLEVTSSNNVFVLTATD